MSLSPVILASDSVGTASTFQCNIPRGKYESIFAVLTGTSATTLTEPNVGRIRLSETGRDLINAEAQWLRRMGCLKGGHHRRTFAAAGVTEYTVKLPRNYYDRSVHLVTESDNCQLSITHGAAWATQMSAAQWKVYGLVRQTGEHLYTYRLTQLDLLLSVAGTFTQTIREENVCALYIEKEVAATLIEQVRIVQDGEVAANVLRGEDLGDISDIENQTDALVIGGAASAGFDTNDGFDAAPGSAIMEIATVEPGEHGEMLSDECTMEINVSGSVAGVLSIVIASVDFSPIKLDESKLLNAGVYARKMTRKNTLNRSRPLAALRVAQGG